jgi:hypothetical protein
MAGEDPSLLFIDNSKEKALSKRMKYNFDTYRGVHKIDVVSINDKCVRFVTQVFLRKIGSRSNKIKQMWK